MCVCVYTPTLLLLGETCVYDDHRHHDHHDDPYRASQIITVFTDW